VPPGPAQYGPLVTTEAARALIPDSAVQIPIRFSKSGRTLLWAYEEETRVVYVMFGGPGRPVSMYAYPDVPPADVMDILRTGYTSGRLRELVIDGVPKQRSARLYPPGS